MRHLRVTTLGGLRFHLGSNEIRFSTKKTAVLLAYLAMQAGRRISREALCDLLWSDRPDAQARHSLSQALSEIRRAVGDDIVNSDGRIAWIDAGQVWVDAFELARLTADKTLSSLEQAEALYQGAFLAFGELGQERFDDWLSCERERLRQIAQTGLVTALTLRANDADSDRRLSTARAILALDPFDERAHCAVMLAYAAQGCAALALDHYDRLKRTLRQELGVDPDEETIETFRSIAGRPRTQILQSGNIEEYAFVLEQLPHPVVVTDLQSRIIGWNAIAENTFGIAKSKIYGRTPAVFMAPGQDSGQSDAVLKHALKKDLWSKSVNVMCNGQRTRQKRIVAPLFTPAGQPIGAFGHGITL
jgi:PAS domain S-box-containing protein